MTHIFASSVFIYIFFSSHISLEAGTCAYFTLYPGKKKNFALNKYSFFLSVYLYVCASYICTRMNLKFREVSTFENGTEYIDLYV